MPTPPLKREQVQPDYDALLAAVEAKYSLTGPPSAFEEAGRMLTKARGKKVSGSDVRRRVERGVQLGWWAMPAEPAVEQPQTEAPAALPPPVEQVRQERHDASFWRVKANALERQLAQTERLAEQLAGVRGQGITVPDWLLPARTKDKRKAVLGLLLSDLHVGEVVDPDEIMGLNRYDVDVFRARIRRLFSAVVAIGPRWAADCDLVGAILFLAGDLISGDIHDELRITNALTSHEQVRVAVEEITAGIRHLVGTYGRVHVVSVPGNHGRTTHKPTAKLYSRLSYDTMAASMVQDRFEGEERVTFQISAGIDAVTPVLGWTILTTHGDNLGSRGGMGFAGPILPIVRGANKVSLQQFRAKRQVDLILCGHYHTSSNPGPVLSNGSIPAYTEYGNGLRAQLEPPQQWLFLLHERWGLRERSEIKLEDPIPPPLPRVRVPAFGRAA